MQLNIFSVTLIMIKNHYFEDFIGVFETEYDTQPMLDYFTAMVEANYSMNRTSMAGRDNGPNTRVDTMVNVNSLMFHTNMGFQFMRDYNQITGRCLNLYLEEYEQLHAYRYQQIYLNLQKTKPGQGYHQWHSETGGQGNNQRLLATMMYMNDVEEGGETEFLYQSKRYKPTKGTFLIWPAGFTHTHRGNPPLSGEKYIATSWVENSLI